ncbi:MAG: flagellar brake protein [Candidatus Magnetominusculus sp. LBB02]|nr:flagellar brake protein [Candidatus Magnetominusculus sp. LBB02]
MNVDSGSNKGIYSLNSFDIGVAAEVTCDAVLSKVSAFIVDVKPEGILIKPKGMDDFHEKIPSGTELTVRCFIGESVFRFSSVLKSVVFEPTLLALISSPDILHKEERRIKQRITCKLPCVLLIKDNRIKACVQDLTPTGCRCSLYESGMMDKWSAKFLCEEDSAVEVLLPIGGTNKEQSVNGTIKYVASSYDRFDVGIEFHLSVEEEKEMIETILKRGW